MNGVLRRIRFERLLRGWNQVQLAHVARMCQQDISKIEQGRLLPTAQQRDRLARAFGIAPSELLRPHVVVVEPEEEILQDPEPVR